MMANETEELTAEEYGGQPPEPHGYSIAAKAGDDLAAQLQLADWHGRKASEARVLAEAIAAPFDAEIERLGKELARLTQARADAIADQVRCIGWHEEQVIRWFPAFREATGKKSVSLPYLEIKSSQGRGKTEIDEGAVMDLAAAHPGDFEGLVENIPTVNKKAVRERFELREDGTVLDKTSGEIVEAPILSWVELPSLTVTVTLTGQPKAEEGGE